MTTVYQTFSVGEAHRKIYITQQKQEADLFVYIVGNKGLATRDGQWYLSKNRTEVNVRVYFSSRAMAELIVYFVNNRSEAGWQKSHHLKGRL